MKSTVFSVDPKLDRVGGADDPKLSIKPHSAPYSSKATPARSGPVDVSDGPNDGTKRSNTHSNLFGAQSESPATFNEDPNDGQMERLEDIKEQIRAALRARGAVGIQGLARNFKICDTSRNGKLERDELQKCIRICRVPLSEADFGMLFSHCDADGSGEVDYEEFLKVVRGRMKPLRRKLVGQVFRHIDQLSRKGGRGQGDGLLTAEDLKDAFSGKEHPEVKAG